MQRARQDERLDREKERLGGAYGRAREALGELAEAAGGTLPAAPRNEEADGTPVTEYVVDGRHVGKSAAQGREVRRA
jgi:hypothetical protein